MLVGRVLEQEVCAQITAMGFSNMLWALGKALLLLLYCFTAALLLLYWLQQHAVGARQGQVLSFKNYC